MFNHSSGSCNQRRPFRHIARLCPTVAGTGSDSHMTLKRVSRWMDEWELGVGRLDITSKRCNQSCGYLVFSVFLCTFKKLCSAGHSHCSSVNGHKMADSCFVMLFSIGLTVLSKDVCTIYKTGNIHLKLYEKLKRLC